MSLLTIGSWWSTLSGTQQLFWSIAIVSSVLFVIQFVFSLIGVDLDTDAEIDVGGADMDDTGYSLDESFSIFSTRSIIAFFTFFGWTGVLTLNAGGSTMTALIAASLSGIAAMFLVAYLMWQFAKLTQEGNVDINTALFKSGEVYLTIPPKNEGQGKVHINIQGVLKEVDAITDSDNPIPTGSFIKVVEVVKNRILVVKLIEK